MQLTSVKTLNGTNYEDWKESLDLYLAITNMDLALREAVPPALTDQSTVANKASREKWDHSNRVCLMVMKYTMEKSIRQSILETDNAVTFLKSVGEKFKRFDKAQKGQFLGLLEKTKYDGASGVREHIMSGSNFIVLVLYVDDILLASSCVKLLNETKQVLNTHFDMKDLGDAFFVLDIQIHHDRSKGILGLSQRGYIEKVLKRFNMHSCSSCAAPIQKDVVSWKSVKQTLTATSTMEVEYVTCYEATCQAMWLKKLIFGFHIVESISKPLVIYCDNTVVVHFSQNNRSATRSKHFDIKYLFFREKVREFQTRIEYTTTGHMLEDPLTKGLPIGVYQRHVTHMGLVKSFDILG